MPVSHTLINRRARGYQFKDKTGGLYYCYHDEISYSALNIRLHMSVFLIQLNLYCSQGDSV